MTKKLRSWLALSAALGLLTVALPVTAQVIPDPQEREWEMTISDAAVTEGAAGSSVAAEFTVELQEGARLSKRQTTVDFATVDDSARASTDYGHHSGRLTFAPGEVKKTVQVTVFGDNAPEPQEQFFLHLSNPDGAHVGRRDGIGTINDDDNYVPPGQEPGPETQYDLVVSNTSVAEGGDGTSMAEFTVSLDPLNNKSSTITAEYETVDGSASVSDADYRGRSGVLTFPPDTTQRTVEVPVSGDFKSEPDESFFLKLGGTSGNVKPENPEACPLPVALPSWDCSNRRWGEAVIKNDDASQNGPADDAISGSLDILDRLPRMQDGLGGVFLTGHDADTNAGSASHNAAGAQNIVRRALGYVLHEKAVPMVLLIYTGNPFSVGSAELSRAGIVASGFPPCPSGPESPPPFACHQIAASTQTGAPGLQNLNEVDFATYDAVIVPSSPALTQAEWQTVVDRNDDLIDYVNGGGGLVGFAYEADWAEGKPFGYLPGIRGQYLGQWEVGYKVTDLGRQIGLTDLDVNGNDSENVFLEAPPGWGVVDVDGRRRIMSIATREKLLCDCPDETHVSISDGEVIEGDHGISLLSLTVSLSAPSSQTVTVEYKVNDGTAHAPKDYLAVNLQNPPVQPQRVIFGRGETSKKINVPVVGDSEVEPDETLSVELFNAVAAAVFRSKATGTIFDDDAAPAAGPDENQDHPGTPAANQRQQLPANFGSSGGPQSELASTVQSPSQNQAVAAVQVQNQIQGQLQVHQGQLQMQRGTQPQAVQGVQAQLSQARTQAAPRPQIGVAMESQKQGQGQAGTAPTRDPKGQALLASELGGRAVLGVVAAAITALIVLPAGLSRPGRQGLPAPIRAEGRVPAASKARGKAAKRRQRHR